MGNLIDCAMVCVNDIGGQIAKKSRFAIDINRI